MSASAEVAPEEAREKAESEGFQVIQGSANQLLLDIDDDHFGLKVEFAQRFAMLNKSLKPFGIWLERKERWTSKSGRGEHVVVQVNSARALSLPERLVLECYLCSDTKRALFGLLNFWKGENEPELLFRPPEKRTPQVSEANQTTEEEAMLHESGTFGFAPPP